MLEHTLESSSDTPKQHLKIPLRCDLFYLKNTSKHPQRLGCASRKRIWGFSWDGEVEGTPCTSFPLAPLSLPFLLSSTIRDKRSSKASQSLAHYNSCQTVLLNVQPEQSTSSTCVCVCIYIYMSCSFALCSHTPSFFCRITKQAWLP